MTEENKSRRRANKQAKIHILVTVNPKRKGTLTYDRFALYEDGMTVAEYVKAGGRTGDVNHDATMGYIELTHA
jgi:hypothetical protein